MKFLVLSLLIGSTTAACPNACSGHGTCGEYDSCSCEKTWIGADCSMRQCMSGRAWVTTSQGDVNFDGDTNDAATYDSDHLFTEIGAGIFGGNVVLDQMNPGGTFEKWPSTFAKSSGETCVQTQQGSDTSVDCASKNAADCQTAQTAGDCVYTSHHPRDEGHFYMECSNRGLCNRESGECECFPGYTGEACRRTVCPEGCSGNGVCKTVGQQNANYPFWDKDQSRSCVCDPGFTGSDCSERLCPVGDDPLTKNQQYETQFIEIFSDDEVDVYTDGAFTGSIRLTYTDDFGQKWTTDEISVAPANNLADSSTGTESDPLFEQLNTDVENALNGLPNDVLSGVSVTSGWCDYVVPGECSLDDTTSITTDGHLSTAVASTLDDSSTSHFFRAPGSSAYTLAMATPGDNPQALTTAYTTWLQADSLATYATPASPFDMVSDPSAATPGTIDNTVTSAGGRTCYYVPKAHCVRIAVTFGGNPGDLNDLEVDLSGLTTDNHVQTALTAPVTHTGSLSVTSVGATVSDLILVGTLASTHGATFTGASIVFSYVHPSDLTITCTYSAATTLCSTSGKIITLGSSATEGSMFRPYERIRVTCGSLEIGTYTVSDTVTPAAGQIAVMEDMPSCDGTTLATEVTISMVSSFITVNADVRGRVQIGDRLQYLSSITPPVSRIEWDVSAEHGTTAYHYDNSGTTAGTTDGSTVATFAGIEGRVFFSETWAVPTSASNSQGLEIYGKGTTEANECSDRGVCDYETGQCTCFGGYTGLACSIQHSLQA